MPRGPVHGAYTKSDAPWTRPRSIGSQLINSERAAGGSGSQDKASVLEIAAQGQHTQKSREHFLQHSSSSDGSTKDKFILF